MSTQPFVPQGNTVAVTPTTTSSATAIGNVGGFSPGGVRVNNQTGTTVFIAFVGAGGTVTIPVPGTPANGIPITASQVEVYTATGGSPLYVACILASGTASGSIYFTPGEGV